MSYKFDSIVNRAEVNALKEMIFKRAAEKSEANVEKEYDDIMDLARNSFESQNNPFARIAGVSDKETVKSELLKSEKKVINEESLNERKEIGFPIKRQDCKIQSKVLEEIKSQTFINSMKDARESLSKNVEFNNAVEFLNNQALVSMLKIKSRNFEIIV